MRDGQFDADASTQAKEQAIRQVEIAADLAWKEAALAAVEYVATRRERFTTDAVWFVLNRSEMVPPREPRALGPVMRRAQKAGLCMPTDEFHLSIRVSAHRKPQRVWRSLVCR